MGVTGPRLEDAAPRPTPARRPLHKRAAHNLGGVVRAISAAITGPRAPDRPLAAEEVERVLIVRINHRLGNTVLLTPLVRYVSTMFPRARIDVLIGEPAFGPLLQSLPGVDRVLGAPLSVLQHPLQLWRLVRKLREGYDLVIDPVGRSTNGRLASAVARSRWRLGFPPPSEWTPSEKHAAWMPLELLDRVRPDGVQPRRPRLDIALQAAELDAGRAALAAQLERQSIDVRERQIVGFFVDARGDKLLDVGWWNRWRDAMRRGSGPPALVQLLPPEGGSVVAGVASVGSRDLRAVAALLAAFDAFVSIDSGPMHLAVAAGVPTVGLFTITDPREYGPQGPHDLALRIEGLGPERVAEAVREHVAGLPRKPAA